MNSFAFQSAWTCSENLRLYGGNHIIRPPFGPLCSGVRVIPKPLAFPVLIDLTVDVVAVVLSPNSTSPPISNSVFIILFIRSLTSCLINVLSGIISFQARFSIENMHLLIESSCITARSFT